MKQYNFSELDNDLAENIMETSEMRDGMSEINKVDELKDKLTNSKNNSQEPDDNLTESKCNSQELNNQPQEINNASGVPDDKRNQKPAAQAKTAHKDAKKNSTPSVGRTHNKLQIIIECAMLIAIGTVLAQIKLFRMPSGGSVTAASMVPFLLISYRHGSRWGLLSAFANVLLQIALGGLYPPIAPGPLAYAAEILFDYFLAYMAMGLSYMFYKPFKNSSPLFGVGFSTFMCCFLRFLAAFISGFLVWADIAQDGTAAVIYSLGYNAAYLAPETLVTIIVMLLLFKKAKRIFSTD